MLRCCVKCCFYVYFILLFVFFFSSRRRHTRLRRDCSSDVCSSDLKPPGKLLKSAHAVDREYRVITALNRTDVPVPTTYALCEDIEIIGTAFYLMEFMEGRVLWDPSMSGSSKGEALGVYTSMNSTLAKLHSVDPFELDLESFGRPGNYVGRQIGRAHV